MAHLSVVVHKPRILACVALTDGREVMRLQKLAVQIDDGLQGAFFRRAQFKDRADYAQKEAELLNYLRGVAGTSAVVIYLKDVNAMKRLPAGYHVQISDFMLADLRQKYGDSNVKVVERVLKNF